MVLQRRGYCGDLMGQIRVAEFPLASLLVPEDERGAIVAVAEQVFREVEMGPRKPARAPFRIRRCHPVESDHDAVPWALPRPLVSNDTTEAPHLGPECLGAVD
jgi:hypothetical protein